MRYIIIGAGSVGGTIGGRLAEAGHDVALVARGEHLKVLKSDGLTLSTPEARFRPETLAVSGPAELVLTPNDVLILAVKSQDTVPLLEQWNAQPVSGGGIAADQVPIFCAQNGVANEWNALRYFARVYGVCTWLPATLTAPGHVVAEAHPVSGILDVGPVCQGIYRNQRTPLPIDDLTTKVVADLSGSGFLAYEQEKIMPWKYSKLLRNLSNAIQAACGRSTSLAARELERLALSEADCVYQEAGIEWIDLKDAYARRGDQVTVAEVAGQPRGGGSSWQSLNRGLGSIEADYLNGEIVVLGRLNGVPTPVNELLRQVANHMAQERQAPGSIDPEELLAQVRDRANAA